MKNIILGLIDSMNKICWYLQIKLKTLLSQVFNLGYLINTNKSENLRNVVKYISFSKKELIQDISGSIIIQKKC